VVEFPTPASQEGNQGRGAGLWPGKPPPCLVPDRLPGRHVLRCREVLSLGQPFSLMRGCRRQQVPRSETHWEVPVPTAWWDPEGQQSKRDFLEEVFAPTTVLAKAAKSSSCRVSAHMQQISVVNFVVSSTPQGSAALPRARDPVLCLICSQTSAQEAADTAWLRLLLQEQGLCWVLDCTGVVAMGNISVCENFKIQPSVSKHLASSCAEHPQSWGQIKTVAKRLPRARGIKFAQ